MSEKVNRDSVEASFTDYRHQCLLSVRCRYSGFFYFGFAVFYLVLFVSFFWFLGCFPFFFMFLVLSVGNPLSEVIGSKAQGPSSSFVKLRLRA